MPTWPATLPQAPNGGDYQETPPELLLETQMEAGPPKSRRRFTAGVRKLSLPYRFEPGQLEIFDAFLMDDLENGALPFDFPWPPAPRATATVSVKLLKKPTYKSIGAGVFDLTLEVGIQP